MLERCEVEGSRLFNMESVRSSFVERLRNCCGVPGDFLRDTPILDQSLSFAKAKNTPAIPYVHTSPSKSITLYGDRFDPVLPARSPCTSQTSTTTTNDEEVTFFADGSHDFSGS